MRDGKKSAWKSRAVRLASFGKPERSHRAGLPFPADNTEIAESWFARVAIAKDVLTSGLWGSALGKHGMQEKPGLLRLADGPALEVAVNKRTGS